MGIAAVHDYTEPPHIFRALLHEREDHWATDKVRKFTTT